MRLDFLKPILSVALLLILPVVGWAQSQPVTPPSGGDAVSVDNNVPPPQTKCTASISMRSVPSLPGLLNYRCPDSSIISVRAYVTVDGALVIIPMRRDTDGTFSTDIPVSTQGPTFIAFQQQGTDKRIAITDNVPYAAACPDALSFLSEKNSPFGPVSERNMRQAIKLGQEIEQLSYIKGALDRIAKLGLERGGQ